MNNKCRTNSRGVVWLLLAVLFLAGCSGEKTDIDDRTDEDRIGFDCRTQNLTGNLRIAETTIENIQYFRVSAVWDKGAAGYEIYMDHQLVEKQGSNWVYSPVRYWPTLGTVSFFAYSPATSSGVESFHINNSDNKVSIEYKVSNDYQKQEDFMVATNLEKTSSPVQLDFKHALSLIEFKACSNVADTTFRIREIKLTQLNSKGTLVGSATGNISTWTWENISSPTDYIMYQKYPFETQGTTYKEVGSLMVLPQKPGNNFKIVVDCDIIESSESKIVEYAIDNDLVFEPGKKYTFFLTFSLATVRNKEKGITTTPPDPSITLKINNI